MRKTSFGLGLAGTIIAFVIGVILLIVGAVSTAASYADWDEISENFDDVEITIDGDEYNVDIEGNYGNAPNVVFGAIGAWLIVGAVCLIIAGVLGIIGTVITRKHQSVAAGVLLIIASVLSIVSLWGLFATAFFIPAGVLAFIKDKNKQVAPAPQDGAVQ